MQSLLSCDPLSFSLGRWLTRIVLKVSLEPLQSHWLASLKSSGRRPSDVNAAHTDVQGVLLSQHTYSLTVPLLFAKEF